MEEHYKNLSLDDIKGEIWKDIEGYVGSYQVSNMGRIKSIVAIQKKYKKDRILKQSIAVGYCNVCFRSGKFGLRIWPLNAVLMLPIGDPTFVVLPS